MTEERPIVLAMRVDRDPRERNGRTGRTAIQRVRQVLKQLLREHGLVCTGYSVPLTNPIVRPGGEYI